MGLKSASGRDKEKMIGSIEFADHLAPEVASPPANDRDLEIWNVLKWGCWRMDAEGTFRHTNILVNWFADVFCLGLSGYHGPSSIYTSELLSSMNPDCSKLQSPTASSVSPIDFTLHDSAVHECLAIFFHWNQPHSSFIDWDSFLMEYMDNDISREHCSSSLVLAMSSLGALMSSDNHIRSLADSFFDSAVASLQLRGLLTPCLTSIQALMCCAIFQLGKGNASKGWMYSSMWTLDGYDSRTDTRRYGKQYGSGPWFAARCKRDDEM
jgi:hypothetical protein